MIEPEIELAAEPVAERVVDGAVQRRPSRPVPIELSGDPRITGRVRRLALVSVIALGLIWRLAETTLAAPPAVGGLLLSGWILMPTILAASLREPRLRYLLVVPASLVTIGLLLVCLGWLPADRVAALGWLLLTAGIALGGLLGLWLWYRVMPVPGWLDEPLGAGRWALIAVHVGLVVAGGLMAAIGAGAG